MQVKDAEKQIEKIIKEGAIEAGVFISLLVDKYMKTYDVSKNDFDRSLNNSLKILNKETDMQNKNKKEGIK